MLPPTHFLVGLVFGLIGVNLGLFDLNIAILIGILTVLIDVDHLIFYYKHKKKINFKECWNFAFQKYEWTFIHEWPAFLIIILFLIIYSQTNLKFSYIVFAIYVPHFLLDHLHIKLNHKIQIIKGWRIPFSNLEIFIDLICLISLVNLLF